MQPAILFPLIKNVTFPGAFEIADIEATVLSAREVGADSVKVAAVKFILIKVTYPFPVLSELEM